MTLRTERTVTAFLWASLGLLVCALLFYWPLMSGAYLYSFRDMQTILLPMEHSVQQYQQLSIFPLWNPYPVLGKPMAAEPLAALFYPPAWAARFFPLPYSFSFSLIFHHVLAGCGLYLLSRNLLLGRIPSFVGALTFAFGGTLVSMDNMINALQSTAWLPWVLLFVLRWDTTRREREALFCALAIALTLLGGMPEVLLIEAALIAGVLIGRKRSLAKLLKASAATFLIGLTGLAMAAMFLLPFIEYLARSSRSVGIDAESALHLSLHPLNLFGLLIPYRVIDSAGIFRAQQSIASGYFSSLPWALTNYVGAALPLAIAGLLRISKRAAITSAGLAVLFTALAFGKHNPLIVSLYDQFPLLGSVRYPEKWFIGTYFLLAVGAAFGAEALLRRFSQPIAIAATILHALCLFIGNSSLIPVIEWETLTTPPDYAGAISREIPPIRVYANQVSIPQGAPLAAEALIRKESLVDGIASQFSIANLNYPASINLQEHETLYRLLGSVAKSQAANILRALGVEYVISQKELKGYADFHEMKAEAPVHLYKVQGAKARAYIPKAILPVADQEQALAHLRVHPNPADVVAAQCGATETSAGEGEIAIVRYSPNRIVLKAAMEQPGLVVLSDTFYPGWIARVNEARVPICRINGLVRGVLISAGESKIIFDYEPESYRVGRVISILAFVVIGAFLIWDSRSKKQKRPC